MFLDQTASAPTLAAIDVVAAMAIGLAHLAIALAMLVLLRRRRDLAVPWLFGLFAAVIAACGVTHLLEAAAPILLMPAAVSLAGLATAMLSVAAAVAIWPVLPRLLALPSPAALAREVEERRIAEARARASEARQTALFESMAEAILVLRAERDGGFVVERVNPAFEALFGLPRAAMEGRRAEEALPPGLVAQAVPRWRDGAASGHRCTYEVQADTPAGLRIWQTALVPVAAPGGEVERLLVTARDVTDTRRLQTGLVQSARLATVGTMCAGLAHETSQPLNAALLWLRKARAALAGLPAETAARLGHALGVVDGQIRRSGELIGRIRALAGAEAAGGERFDAAEVAAAALRTAAGLYAPDGIELTLEGTRERLPVRGIPARLEQAVLQLLANARDAILERRARDPQAPARIAIALSREGGRAVIEVRDSGGGIPEAIRDAIFDPFFTTKEPGRGIGLGLALAAGIARGMGGGIEARNLDGCGACFRMVLADAPADVAAQAA